jgi:hypothetical protein
MMSGFYIVLGRFGRLVFSPTPLASAGRLASGAPCILAPPNGNVFGSAAPEGISTPDVAIRRSICNAPPRRARTGVRAW